MASFSALLSAQNKNKLPGLVIRALVDSQVQVQGAFFSRYDFRFHKLALVFVQLVHWLDEQVLVDSGKVKRSFSFS